MGWSWRSEDDDGGVFSFSSGMFNGSSNPSGGGDGDGDGDRCATRKVLKSQCHTEEVEPGRFIRKCEKTEEIFKDCLGRPTEMVQSNKEYTEEDVTDQMTKGSFPLESREFNPHFPGLRSDIEAIERDFFGGINKFFEAAEEIKREFFNSVGVPRIYDDESSLPDRRHGIHIESSPPKEEFTQKNQDGDIDLSGLARDV